MKTWNDVRLWRRQERKRLLSVRQSLPLADRKVKTANVAAYLKREFPELAQACIGFCWPFRREIDVRHVVEHFMDRGATAALPVVVEKAQPLEFWKWLPGIELTRGVWDIPVPRQRTPVHPTAILVPLVGFDSAHYRLGYGGGYFDRTLAAMAEIPLTIGVGYEACRLPTIHPQPHDIPMDAIVTEEGVSFGAGADNNRRSRSRPAHLDEDGPS